MSFTWSAQPAPAAEEAGPLGLTLQFAGQAEAEEWFSEHWADLADAGVEAVSLLEAGSVVYGPMPLSA